MLSRYQISAMLDLQSAMNSKVDPDWIARRYPYLRAVVIEGAEAIEHHGWKWWKHQALDAAQLRMELVDIWHFVLSHILLETQGDKQSALAQIEQQLQEGGSGTVVFDGQTRILGEIELLDQLELMIGLSAVRRVELGLFAAILENCGMDWDMLYCQYVSKNVLNFFRQDNGYKQGTYQKVWHGREDNAHLVEILTTMNPQDPHFQDKLYAALAQRYIEYQ